MHPPSSAFSPKHACPYLLYNLNWQAPCLLFGLQHESSLMPEFGAGARFYIDESSLEAPSFLDS